MRPCCLAYGLFTAPCGDDGAERQTCQGFFNVNGRAVGCIHAISFAIVLLLAAGA
jgi:hypothetical protein